MPEIIAELPPLGGYISTVKVVVFCLATIPWLVLAPWVSRDAKALRTYQQSWSLAVLGGGALGLVLWLWLPYYLLGLAVFLLMSLTPIGLYALHRDARVSEENKILTAEFFASLFGGRRGGQKVEPVTRLKLYGKDSKIRLAPDPEESTNDEIETYNETQRLLYEVLYRRASEAEIVPAEGQAEVRLVIDGVRNRLEAMDKAAAEAVIQYIKPIAGLDPEDRRRPQRGMISVDMASQQVDIQVATAGTTLGQRLQLRALNQALRTNIDELGLPEEIRQRIAELTAEGGLAIVASPPACGRTSTLYSLLKSQDPFIHQLVTLERKPDTDIENVTQTPYDSEAKMAEQLASIYRRDPDVILVDHCPNKDVAAVISEAAADKLLLLGATANDAFTALAKWVRVCEDAKRAMGHLKLVLCQVLLRKLCPECKEPYKPDPQMLAKANLPADRIEAFYRPPTEPKTDEKGNPIVCQVCKGTGYFDRTAAFELLEVTDEIRQLIASGATLREIKRAARKNRMRYLQEQALLKVISGETGVQEVLRVTQPPAKKTSK